MRANDRERPAPEGARVDEPAWRRYLRFYRPDPAADLDDELRDHIESAVEALVAGGLSPAEARAEALRRFGDVARVRHEVGALDARHLRRTRRVATLDALAHDLRYALRVLRRSPGFAAVAALSIALGVAANATVFAVVNAVLLRPIPGTQAERLVRVYVDDHSPFEWRDLEWFRERATSFEHLVGERYGGMALQAPGAEGAERVRTSLVTRGYFAALGVPMALGRAFDADERAAAGAEPVAVLSHRFWQRRFAGDPAVVGRAVSLGGHPVTIVGVAAPGFASSVMAWTPDLFVPLAAAPALTGTPLDGFGGSLYATARLRPGVDARAAAAELDVLMARLARTDLERYERRGVRLDHVRGVHAEVRGPIGAAAAFLMGMVALVLLIACANVANLLLARAAARRTEIGVRLAIGAGRMRLVRQLLTESLVLAALGGVLGLAGAWALTRVAAAAVPAEAGLARDFFAPDHRVLLFTGALCLLATLLFGLVPALRASSPHLAPLLRGDDGRGATRRRGGALVAVQAALCVVLLAVASLFLRSLASVRGLDPGFRAADVVDVAVDLDLLGADAAAERRILGRLLERARAIPGVESATLAALVPLAGSNMETRVAPSGMTVASRFDWPVTYFNVVAPGYFATLDIPLRRGRDFTDADAPGAARVAIVNETAARRWWPGEDPIGKAMGWGGPVGPDAPELVVIGVARDADYLMPGEDPVPVLYLPLAQSHRGEMVLQLRAPAGPAAVRDAVWDELRALAPRLPPPPVTRMADDMAITQLPVRVGAALLGAFGLVALLLAAAGIYGVTAYSVQRRTREIGIRSALGADGGRLLRMVIGESLRTVSLGAAAGVALATLAAVALGRVLYGVSPLDPLVLVVVPLLIAAVAAAASLVPARRAAAVDPMRAIRTE